MVSNHLVRNRLDLSVQLIFATSHYLSWVSMFRRGLLLALGALVFAWSGCTKSVASDDSGGSARGGSGSASGNGGSGETAGGGAGTGGSAGTEGGGAGTVGAETCEPTLASIQQAIFAPRCALAGCHTGMAPAASLDLSTATASEASLLGVPAALCEGRTRVVAGDAESSLLYAKVSGLQPSECGDRMPVGSMLMPDAMACIETWIAGLDPEQLPVTPDPSCETCGTSACVDVASDASHCGECGVACPTGASCDQGVCRCPAPQILCDGQCSATCNCDGEVCDGACVDTQTDALHCGDCAKACGAGSSCESGSCTCAKTGVSFSMDVAPILANNCAQGGCHATMAPKEGMSLTSTRAFDSLVGVTAAQCDDGRQRVEPGNVAGSYLIDKLLGVDLCKGTRMPKAGQSLPEDDIETIGAWICNGAPDN
jgi:hypothetical protein